jgi:gamma-glutamylcyclotransferase (GGCT)/AIG2-like uncharacterized protein YtfP
MSENSNRPFFVYGTLLPGQPNYYLWGEAAVTREQALLANSRLYDMGHYPMLIEAGNEPVKGLLVRVAEIDYMAVLGRLDYLEGYNPAQPDACAYRRVQRQVRGVNGAVQTAWVYIGRPRYVAGKPAIPGGDWLTYVRATAKESHSWWADIKSVSGLLD